MARVAEPSYRWIKFSRAYLEDREFMLLSDGAAGLYIKLYLLAARGDAAGLLCDDRKVYNLKDIAWQLHSDEDMLHQGMNELTTAGLVHVDPASGGYVITRFLDEQGSIDDATRLKSRERQRRRRELLGAGVEDFSVAQDSEEETEKDSEKDSDLEDRERGRLRLRESRDNQELSRDNSKSSPPPLRGRRGQGEKLEALEVFYRQTQEQVPAEWVEDVLETVQDLELWEAVCHGWVGHGWNKSNIQGMLEVYERDGLDKNEEPI